MAITTIDATTALSNNGITLLNTTTVSSAVANVTFSSSLITDTYMDYKIVFRNVSCATDSQDLYLQPSIDNGSNYNLTIEQKKMYHELKNTTAAGTATSPNDESRFYIMAALSNVTSEGTNGVIELVGLRQTTTTHKGIFWNSMGGISISTGHDSGNDYWWNGGGKIITSSKVNNLKLVMESGNISQGTFSLYGIKSA
tara:strand:- start:335 stop:928 length:594 start_codon:yes stop_codon:yes gene_type:complete